MTHPLHAQGDHECWSCGEVSRMFTRGIRRCEFCAERDGDLKTQEWERVFLAKDKQAAYKAVLDGRKQANPPVEPPRHRIQPPPPVGKNRERFRKLILRCRMDATDETEQEFLGFAQEYGACANYAYLEDFVLWCWTKAKDAGLMPRYARDLEPWGKLWKPPEVTEAACP